LQHGLVVVPPHHRRKLEEIANQNDLQAAEWRLLSPDVAADGIDQASRAGSIEISSMIRTLVFSMRAARRRLVESRSRSRRVRVSRTPMPLQA
jgi:hypothetical protein